MSLYTEDQLALKQMIRDFMRGEVAPVMVQCDRTGEPPLAIYQKAFDLGFHLMEIPEAYGGLGMGALDYAIAKEEMAAVDSGFATGLGASDLTVKVMMKYGTEAQKRRFADRMGPGCFAAFCLTEPQAGSDAAAVRTTAVRDGDNYVLNGTKCFITNGGVADVFLVIAATDKAKGPKGLSAFLVERSMGVQSGKEEDKFGIRLSNTADVILEDVRVPAANLIGEEGKGFAMAMKTLELGRIACAAGAVGLMRHAVELCVDYAKTRTTFGTPIARHQAVSFMLADMKIAEETARQMTYHAARLADAGLPCTVESAIAKTYASDAAMKAATDAVQIFGGYGYSRDYPVEKLMRDAKIHQIYEGTNQIQRVIISGGMLR